MTIEAQDIERINFHHKGKEKFCVEVNQVTGTLELWVNGEKKFYRNKSSYE